MILNELPFITQLKRQIYLLKKTYTSLKSLEKKDVISFTKEKLAPTTRKNKIPAILDIIMTYKIWKNSRLDEFWWTLGHHLTFRIIIVSRRLVGRPDAKVTPIKLKGFTTYKMTTKGTITLNVTLGWSPNSRIGKVQFYVVDVQLYIM